MPNQATIVTTEELQLDKQEKLRQKWHGTEMEEAL